MTSLLLFPCNCGNCSMSVIEIIVLIQMYCVSPPFLSPNIPCQFIRYHLKDVIVGKIYFLLVRIKIKYMELAIVKRETTGTGDEN